MQRKYHPDNLPICQFTGRVSMDTVRSNFDGRYYDDVVLDELRGNRVPASLEVVNPHTKSTVVPGKSTYRKSRHLTKMSENDRNEILKWVGIESINFANWIADNNYGKCFPYISDKNLNLSKKFSEIIIREPDKLLLLRLLCFNVLLRISQDSENPYSSDLEFCFKLLAVQVMQNKYKINSDNIAVDQNFLRLLTNNRSDRKSVYKPIESLKKIDTLQTANILSYLSYKDFSSYLCTQKNSISDQSYISSVFNNLHCAYEFSLYSYYLSKDYAISNIDFYDFSHLGSNRIVNKKVAFSEFFSNLGRDYLSDLSDQRSIIIKYRNEKIDGSDEVQKQVKLAIELERQKLDAERLALESSRVDLENQKLAMAQEKTRLQKLELRLKSMQKIIAKSSSSKAISQKIKGVSRFNNTSSFKPVVSGKSQFCHIHRFYAEFQDKEKIARKKVMKEMQEKMKEKWVCFSQDLRQKHFKKPKLDHSMNL